MRRVSITLATLVLGAAACAPSAPMHYGSVCRDLEDGGCVASSSGTGIAGGGGGGTRDSGPRIPGDAGVTDAGPLFPTGQVFVAQSVTDLSTARAAAGWQVRALDGTLFTLIGANTDTRGSFRFTTEIPVTEGRYALAATPPAGTGLGAVSVFAASSAPVRLYSISEDALRTALLGTSITPQPGLGHLILAIGGSPADVRLAFPDGTRAEVAYDSPDGSLRNDVFMTGALGTIVALNITIASAGRVLPFRVNRAGIARDYAAIVLRDHISWVSVPAP